MDESKYKVILDADHEEILRNQPSIIYKYLDWSNPHYKRVLTHNELFFSSPKNFNDPFDSKIETRYDLMTEEEIDEYFTKVSTNLSIYNNLGWDNARIQEEVERLKSEHDLKNLDKVNESNQYLFKERDDFYAVFSASTEWDIIPMWGYYGNSHRGFCVGFGVRELFYSKRVGGGGSVNYDEYPILKPGMPDAKKGHIQTYYKSEDWKHEQEYRLMQLRLPKHENNVVYDNDGNFLGIKTYAHESWFKEILIGVNTSPEDTKAIIRSCKSKISEGAKVYKLMKKNFEFKLIRKEIDPTEYL